MSKYKQGKVLAMTFDVWISGTKLGMSKKSCIKSIEIHDTVSGSDKATIQISDPEFEYIEDNIFVEDNTIKIKMGWDGYSYRDNFEGYISAIDINFESDGCPKLTLSCMDNTHVMNRKKKNRTFKKCTSADVVKKIAQSYGFTCVIDKSYSFKTQDSISQSNQTDIDFITKLAGDEVYPFTARLVGKKFYYVKMGKLTTPKLTLTYREYPHDIISLSLQLNKETKKVEIKSSSVDTKSKSVSSTDGTVAEDKGSASSDSSSKSSGYIYNPKNKKWTKS